MKFVTDDHRTIRLAQQKESRGVIPEPDESLMRSLTAEKSESPITGVRMECQAQAKSPDGYPAGTMGK